MKVFSSLVVGFLLLASANATAGTVQLYSFENGNEGWRSAISPPDATLVIDGALGVTDGFNSARLDDVTRSFKFDVLGTGSINPGDLNYTAFDAISSAIPNGDVRLDFDLSFDFSNVTTAGAIQVAMFVNSGAGFKQYRTSPGGVGQFLDGNTGDSSNPATFPFLGPEALTDAVTLTQSDANTYRVSVPLGPRLTFETGGAYQIGFNTNGNWQGTIDLAIDNVTVSGQLIPEPSTFGLFSLGMLAAIGAARRLRN